MQGTLEAALARVLRLEDPPRLTVAGRTDAGVHATGQVAHVDLEVAPDDHKVPDHHEVHNLVRLRRGLNGVLPPDVRVWSLVPAPPGFDARFSALSRRYGYRIAEQVGSPLRRHDTLTWARPLDVTRMNTASEALLGEHDFAAFCKRREGATTIRRLLRLDWTREGDGVLLGTVVADAFCHSMVRALVGALLAVGEGRKPVDWPGTVLGAEVRNSSVAVAPALGLTLHEVRYPEDEALAARVEQTRRLRGQPAG
ncbi:MAG: tRNA pseudouridine38-40 synthase [Frankiaceae bacterium]|nr:tRNA pseudouridine38-40 synthase [Frankiaceae bacterium]